MLRLLLQTSLYAIFIVCKITVERVSGDCVHKCKLTATSVNCSHCQCSTLPDNISPFVTDIDMSWNAFHVESALLHLVTNLSNLDNLTRLYLSGSIAGYGILTNETFSPLKRLTELDISNADVVALADDSIRNLNTLLKLDMSYMKHLQWDIPDWFFPVSLSELMLNGNTIVHITPNTFKHLYRLKKLFLRECSLFNFETQIFPSSLLRLDLTNSRNWLQENFSVFSNLHYLESLQLSNSGIHVDSRSNTNLFAGLISLQELQLAGNCISWLPSDFFTDLHNLIILNLSRNVLSGWDDEALFPIKQPQWISFERNSLEIIFALPYWNGPLEIDFSRNYFNCSCERSMQSFVQWIHEAKERGINVTHLNSYTCYKPTERRGEPLIDAMRQVALRCKWLPWLPFISLLLVVVVLIVLAVLCHRYRWYLRWYFYRCCRRKTKNRSWADYEARLQHATDEYDVYISYGPGIENDIWAEVFVTKLLHQMENSRTSEHDPNVSNQYLIQNFQVGFNLQAEASTLAVDTEADEMLIARPNPLATNGLCKIYVECRKIRANEWEIEQLAEAIFTSRNVIIALSSDYLRNSRRLFELHLAQQAMVERYGYSAHAHIILVALQDTAHWMHLLPNQLSEHFGRSPLVWSENDQIKEKCFWTELMKRLTSYDAFQC